VFWLRQPAFVCYTFSILCTSTVVNVRAGGHYPDILRASQLHCTKWNAENCTLPGCYEASSGNFLPTFRDNLSVPCFYSWPLKKGPIGCPETSVRNYHHSLRNSPEERRSHLLRGGSLKWHKWSAVQTARSDRAFVDLLDMATFTLFSSASPRPLSSAEFV